MSFSFSVPRAGVEPARVAPLVFETSASTDSAIWALFYSGVPEQMRCKGSAFFDNRQIFRAVFCSMKLRERNGMRRTWEKARTVTVTVCRSAVEKQLQPHAPRQVPTKYVDTFLNIL